MANIRSINGYGKLDENNLKSLYIIKCLKMVQEQIAS